MDGWLLDREVVPRPIVVVEDHLYHIDRLLAVLDEHAPELISQLAIVCLERPGPDTAAAVRGWESRYSQLMVASVGPGRGPTIAPQALASAPAYCRAVGALVRPGGLLVQDIQLESLDFIHPDRWWESIYLANTIRGALVPRAPHCLFMSNKRGFSATWGRDLLDAGFDPRNVVNKDELDSALVPMIVRALATRFAWTMRCSTHSEPVWLADEPSEQAMVGDALDLVLWPELGGRRVLGGRALAGAKDSVELAADSHEATTWDALLKDALHDGPGISVRDVGLRVGPELSGRAEQSNAAARHAYALRRRLGSTTALATVEHHYRLDRRLRVGFVTVR